MRLIKVNAPHGQGPAVVELAFRLGVAEVVTYQQQLQRPGRQTTRDMVEVEVSTPMAKTFVDALLAAPFFDRAEFTVNVRQPRALLSAERMSKLTRPLIEPTSEIFQELWQFSHLTFGWVGRLFGGGWLLALGMIRQELLLMVAGLLFLPLLPLLLAMGFGAWTRQWRLAAQGLMTLSVGLGILLAAGVSMAFWHSPPLLYQDFHSLPVGALISAVVGAAAGLATGDDTGRRELIGLAAASQVAIIPVWLGITLVFAFPALPTALLWQRGLTLLTNSGVIMLVAMGVYALLGVKAAALPRGAARGNHDAS